MKKICVVTATRAEYGYLRWLIKDIQSDSSFELLLVVTGTHLDKTQGYTIEQIKSDGNKIVAEIDVHVDNSTPEAICETMSRYGEKFSKVLSKLKPDVIVVLGDRYELLPICSIAFMLQIPIAHLSGGDVTEGALDDGVRNAVTMLSSFHFPITDDCAKNICRMRGDDSKIFVTGSTSLDFFNRMSLMSREELAENLGLNSNKKWVLCTLHSETKQTLNYNILMASNLIRAMKDCLSDYQIVITNANADLGGKEINELMVNFSKDNPKKVFHVPSLGQTRYLSFMKQVELVLGNSSSGILESPYLGIPTVNVGERQKGRYCCENIIQSSVELSEIKESIDMALHGNYALKSNYWGDGNATSKIIEVLRNA